MKRPNGLSDTVRVLRPGGGVPVQTVSMAAGVCLLLVCAGLVVGSILLPLQRGGSAAILKSDEPTPGAGEASVLPRQIAEKLEARRARAADPARLGQSHLFLVDRRPAAVVVAAEEPEDDASETETEPQRAPRASDDAASEAPARISVLRVESAEDVGGEIRESYRELVLRGIHTDRSGRIVALIDHSGSGSGAAGAAVRVREGEEFTEPKHAAHPWKIAAIDADRNRVVIERQDRRLALALFGTGPVDLSPVVIQPPAEPGQPEERVRVAEDGTIVVERRPDEAIAELRQEVGQGEPDQTPITVQDLSDLLDAFRDLERFGERDRIERERRSRD